MIITFIILTTVYIVTFVYLIYKYLRLMSQIKLLCDSIIDFSEKHHESILSFRDNLDAVTLVIQQMLARENYNKGVEPVNKQDGGDEYMLGDILNE